MLAILTLSTISCAEESHMHKRSIFGEHYHGHLSLSNKKIALGNIVDLGHHVEPFTASEDLSLHNSYSHPNLHHHESYHVPASYQNVIQENSFKFLPVESSLIPEHKDEFIPASFEKKAPLEHFFINEKYSEDQFGQNLRENFLESFDDPVKAPPEEEHPPHKPFVALGSGSLGATKLPNGQIVIGSGSLGYGGANNNNNVNANNNNNNNQFGRNLDSFVTTQSQGNSFSNSLFRPARLESLPQGDFTNGFPYFIQ